MAGTNPNPELLDFAEAVAVSQDASRMQKELHSTIGRAVAQSAATTRPTTAVQHRDATRRMIEQTITAPNFMVFAWRIEDGRIIQEHSAYMWPDDDFPKAWALARDKMMEIRGDPTSKVLMPTPRLAIAVPVEDDNVGLG